MNWTVPCQCCKSLYTISDRYVEVVCPDCWTSGCRHDTKADTWDHHASVSHA